ncbi:MAG TPA: alpha/beta hydrolase [Rhodanobacter sp.]|jgi:pimeloyl-[acyl-carrier protein] methyl ester esterase|nr:alpha/beta hydrolase [Rhodanobacter sp.]
MNGVDPVLVLMPGLDGSGRMFERFEALLPQNLVRQRITYSANLPATLDAYAEHAYAQLPAAGDVILLAESFSGSSAVFLAHRLGNRLKALILCASFVTPPHPFIFLARGLPVRAFELKNERRLLKHYCVGWDAPDAIVGALSKIMHKLGNRTVQQRLRLLASIDLTVLLRELTVPILLLQATRDKLVSRRAQLFLERAVPQAQITHIAGPHFLLQTNPDDCWNRIREWMKQHALIPITGSSTYSETNV